MFIDARFDSGNIEVVSINGQAEAFPSIRHVPDADHAQKFHFRLLGGESQNYKFVILNAGKAS